MLSIHLHFLGVVPTWGNLFFLFVLALQPWRILREEPIVFNITDDLDWTNFSMGIFMG